MAGKAQGAGHSAVIGGGDLTRAVVRGVRRWLAHGGWASLTEVPLPDGRRLDVLAVDAKHHFFAIEAKVSAADLRQDTKWPLYRAWCDQLAFAVPTGFDIGLLPDGCGAIVADAFGADEVRPPPMHPLSPARRRALLHRFARLAAQRLHRLEDPGATMPGVS